MADKDNRSIIHGVLICATVISLIVIPILGGLDNSYQSNEGIKQCVGEFSAAKKALDFIWKSKKEDDPFVITCSEE